MSKSKTSKGIFIVFEGGERAGKSTAIKFVRKELIKRGYGVAPLTHEPGGTDMGQKIRKIVKYRAKDKIFSSRAEALLFFADRAQHVEETIKPQLEQGLIVLCDRYSGSTFAYQGNARSLDMTTLKMIDSWAKQDLEPDLYILFDIDPRIAHLRGLNPNDRIENENMQFHDDLRKGFWKIASGDPRRWGMIDASRPKKEVGLDALNLVLALLKKINKIIPALSGVLICFIK